MSSPSLAETPKAPKRVDEALYCMEVLYAIADLSYAEGKRAEGNAFKFFGKRWLRYARGVGGPYRKYFDEYRKAYKVEAKRDVARKKYRYANCGKMVGF